MLEYENYDDLQTMLKAMGLSNVAVSDFVQTRKLDQDGFQKWGYIWRLGKGYIMLEGAGIPQRVLPYDL